MEGKYTLTENVMNYNGRKIYQIKALKDFGDVKAGELGGWIGNEKNLSQSGNCWVSENAIVCDDALVRDNAQVMGYARVFDSADISEEAKVSFNSKISGCAEIFGNAFVGGNIINDHVMIGGNAQVEGSITGSACIMDNAKVGRNVLIGENSVLCGNANVLTARDIIVLPGPNDDTFTFFKDKNGEVCYTHTEEESYYNGTLTDFKSHLESLDMEDSMLLADVVEKQFEEYHNMEKCNADKEIVKENDKEGVAKVSLSTDDPKYEITANTMQVYEYRDDKVVYQIRALKDFGDVKAGELGGWIESEENLSQSGNCWVADNAMVYDHAQVRDNAILCGNANACDHALITGNAKLFDKTWIAGDARVSGQAELHDFAYAKDDAIINDFALVSGLASVSGEAKVLNHAKIDGTAIIGDCAVVKDNACIEGNALVIDQTTVSGNASVREGAKIQEYAVVEGNCCICGSATVSDNSRVSGDAVIKGIAFVGGETLVGGNAILGGDAYIHSNRDYVSISEFGKNKMNFTFYKDFNEIDSFTVSDGKEDSTEILLNFKNNIMATRAFDVDNDNIKNEATDCLKLVEYIEKQFDTTRNIEMKIAKSEIVESLEIENIAEAPSYDVQEYEER